ncbi:MAG TPA: hypothetical protein VJ461_06415 [Candidatus Nanoarchaeia archaeon]|nr:hypothetical protein [Candidatus Nanoarchaeia archaeon]
MKEKQHSLEEFYKDAGKELGDKILGFIKEEAALKWFYTAQLADFKYKTPYEMCKKGKHEKVDSLISALMEGVFL